MNSKNPLLKVEQLQISAADKTLVQNLNFVLYPGECLGIVGESGSGKSLSVLSIIGLLPSNLKAKGSIRFKEKELIGASEADFLKLRAVEIAMIFQEPMSALNPSQKCGKQVAEVFKIHTKLSGKEIKKRVLKLFSQVDIADAEKIFQSYPHEISGGQKQRVVIAIAIACNPDLLIADEATTALDASVRGEIIDLLKNLQKDLHIAVIFISHDLGAIRRIAHRTLVMHHGVLKEEGITEELFTAANDVYTQGLLACRPSADTYFKRLPLVKDFLENEHRSIEVVSPQVKDERAHQKTQLSPIFELKNVSKIYQGSTGVFGASKAFKALDDISFSIYPSESLGLVGESGSGKSTLGKLLVGLEHCEAGIILFKNEPIQRASQKIWRGLHHQIQVIFQDPFSSLNPKMKIGNAISEVLEVQRAFSKAKARQTTEELLKKVGLLKEYYHRYPHEFSGGQRQRIGIARALAMQPEFIVCDESVSALDVSVQAQILNLLNDLKDEFGFTYLFISHDLNVVRYFCDRIVVLRNGKIIEAGFAEELYQQPKEEYTRQLIEAGI